jgi:hypothetical protein
MPSTSCALLTGEIEETIPNDGKDPAAKALGKLGGKARAQGMSAKRRTEIARHRSAFAEHREDLG